MSEPSVLQSFFGPRKSRRFQPTSWPAVPIVHHGDRNRFPAPLRDGDLSSFERLAQTVETDGDSRGMTAPASGFRGDVRFLGSRGTQQPVSLRATSPSRLLRAGLNIMFHEFRLTSIDAWVDELARQVGIPNQAIRLYAFAAPGGGGQGTDPHWDPNEVVLVQLEGTKKIRLAPNTDVLHPDVGLVRGNSYGEDLVGELRTGLPPKSPQRWREVVLRPGSVVYFPRGTWHETSAEEPSFGVGFGFYWPNSAEVVTDYVRARLRQDVRWRRPLFGLLGDRTAQIHHQAKLNELMNDLGLSNERFVAEDALLLTAPREQRVERLGLGGTYVTMPVTVKKRLQPRGKCLVEIRTNNGHGLLQLELSRQLTDAIGWVARHHSFSLGDLVRANRKNGRKKLESLVSLLVEYGVVQFDGRVALGSRYSESSRPTAVTPSTDGGPVRAIHGGGSRRSPRANPRLPSSRPKRKP